MYRQSPPSHNAFRERLVRAEVSERLSRGMPEHMVPWVERKLREIQGLPLRRCDREQITEQLEDL